MGRCVRLPTGTRLVVVTVLLQEAYQLHNNGGESLAGEGASRGRGLPCRSVISESVQNAEEARDCGKKELSVAPFFILRMYRIGKTGKANIFPTRLSNSGTRVIWWVMVMIEYIKHLVRRYLVPRVSSFESSRSVFDVQCSWAGGMVFLLSRKLILRKIICASHSSTARLIVLLWSRSCHLRSF